MKTTILILTLTLLMLQKVYSQSVSLVQVYPRTIVTQGDSFTVKLSNGEEPWYYLIGSKDTVDLGNDGYKGGFVLVMTKEDTLKFDYKNTPYRQWHYITLQSPKGKTVFWLHFNEHVVEYSSEYIQQYSRQVQFQIPEVYELANIIWALSPSGKKATNLYKDSAYFHKIEKYFSAYLEHPLFKKLDSASSREYAKAYYSFRENSVCFSFKGDKLIYDGPYYHVYGDWKKFGGLFKELLPLVADFAHKANYRKFYGQNLPYYRKLIIRQQALLPVKQMWQWLEQQFPARYDSYKIVFSPLIGASHSTQQFWFMGNRKEFFKEAVMFISGPEAVDKKNQLSQTQKQGLQSGVVFTEIDHNYVNPESDKYQVLIDSIFSDRSYWTSLGGDTDMYDTPISVFNEYMTHALFCLYVIDFYDKATATYIIAQREGLMVKRRGYIKFKEFNEALLGLYQQKTKNERVVDLYPRILAWAKTKK